MRSTFIAVTTSLTLLASAPATVEAAGDAERARVLDSSEDLFAVAKRPRPRPRCGQRRVRVRFVGANLRPPKAGPRDMRRRLPLKLDAMLKRFGKREAMRIQACVDRVGGVKGLRKRLKVLLRTGSDGTRVRVLFPRISACYDAHARRRIERMKRRGDWISPTLARLFRARFGELDFRVKSRRSRRGGSRAKCR